MEDRYMQIIAVKMNDGTLLPIWDFKVDANSVNHPAHGDIYNPEKVEALWDMKKQVVRPFLPIDYRYTSDSSFKIGDKVGVEGELSHHRLKIKVITEITDGRVEDHVTKGSEIIRYILNGNKGYSIDMKNLDPKAKYTIRHIHPAYKFDDGTTCEWEHQMYFIELGE